MKLRIAVTLVVTLSALGVTLMGAAQDIGSVPPPGKLKEDLGLSETILARQFAEFEQSLLRLKQRLERSPNQDDRDRAVLLGRVLEQSKSVSISVQIEQMADFLKTQKFSNVGDIQVAAKNSSKIADDLRDLLALLREDPRANQRREEQKRIEALLKELEKIIKEQQTVQGQTDLNKTDSKELGKLQDQVSKATDNLAKNMTSKGDGKGDGKAGKADGKGSTKDAGKGGDEKAGDTKDKGKATEVAKADTKDTGDKNDKGDSGKQGQAKGDEKGGDPSKGDGDAKPGDKKGDAKDAAAKGSGDAKSGDQKSGDPSKAGGDGKGSDSKSGSSSKSDGQPSQGDAKGGSGPPNQDQYKDEPGEKGKQPAQKGDKNNPDDPKDAIASSKKQVEDAHYDQNRAEDKIGKKDNKGASEDQGDALTKLEKARKKLEDLLRQMREEELERILAALIARCEKMLAMQIAVLGGTEDVDKAIRANLDKMASRENKMFGLKLSDQEKEIVGEASKAIELLEAEGSGVAFPEVFMQVRDDMKHVQKRLEITDAGQVTQAIEHDIIDTLKEMIEALKKTKQDLENKKNQPSPPSSSQPQDQKLLDLIAELKMIRSLQLRINSRTETYGKIYQDKEGEQTTDPNIIRELDDLSARQLRVFEITSKLAKGDNK